MTALYTLAAVLVVVALILLAACLMWANDLASDDHDDHRKEHKLL